jgi:hypothetical protein
VSLVRAELHCLPPLLIQVGTSEVLLDEAPGAIERAGPLRATGSAPERLEQSRSNPPPRRVA